MHNLSTITVCAKCPALAQYVKYPTHNVDVLLYNLFFKEVINFYVLVSELPSSEHYSP